MGTFDHQRLFSQNSRQQIAPWWTFSNEPLLKESILERSIQRHAVSGIGCGASDPNIILLWFFASRPIVAGGRGNLVSPIYNQESFVACPDTYSWSSQCLLDAPLMPIAVESKPIPRAEPSHMPERKKHDLGPWKRPLKCAQRREI